MTKRYKNIIYLIVAVFFLANLIGCQGFRPQNPGELALEDQDFLGFWDAYNTCLAETNIEEVQNSLITLSLAPTPISLDDSPIPVPKFLKKLSSSRTSRLAVDPRAMAASCSIHLAELAQQSADWDTAIHTFQSIVQNYPEPQYAYYVSKANQAIEEFSSIRPVSLSSRNSLVR